MPRRSYSGNAKATTLSGAISAAATSIAVVDGTGYPTGAAGPFVVTIAAGTAAEEKVLCSTRTGNTLAVQARGWDGTTASDHDNAVSLAHTYSATDADEANAHANDTTGNPHPQYDKTGLARIATGTYTGNGAIDRTIPLPFTPMMVWVEDGSEHSFESAKTTAGIVGRQPTGMSNISNVFRPRPVTNGFLVSDNASTSADSTNVSGETFRYVAIG